MAVGGIQNREGPGLQLLGPGGAIVVRDREVVGHAILKPSGMNAVYTEHAVGTTTDNLNGFGCRQRPVLALEITADQHGIPVLKVQASERGVARHDASPRRDMNTDFREMENPELFPLVKAAACVRIVIANNVE